MTIITFYNYDYNNISNELYAYYKTVHDQIKHKICIKLPYYYLISKQDKNKFTNLSCETISYNDFTILTSFDKIIDYKNDEDLNIHNKLIKKDLVLLILDNYSIELKNLSYNTTFPNYQWFFILRNIKLNESYDISFVPENGFSLDYRIFDKIFFKIVDHHPVNFNIFAFDIECYIPKSGEFPNGFNSSISHISVVYRENNIDHRYLYYNIGNSNITYDELVTEEFIEAHKLRNCKFVVDNERNILINFIKLFHNSMKDITVTFNGGGFDIKFIDLRCKCLGINTGLGIILDNIEIKKKNIIENKNNLDYIYLDLFNYSMKTFENMLSSYSLDSVSNYLLNVNVNNYEIIDEHSFKIFLDNPEKYFMRTLSTAGFLEINEESYKILEIDNNIITLSSKSLFDSQSHKFKAYLGKDDVDLFSMYNNYDKDICLSIGLYNLHDSALLLGIIDALSLINTIKVSADIAYLPQSIVLKRYNGSQIKGLILKMSLEAKIAIESDIPTEFKNKFIGAKVMVPKEKFVQYPIMCLDVNSLYPNNIIWGNMSPEKLVGIFKCNTIINLNILYNKLKLKYQYPDFIIIKINEESEAPPYFITVFDRRETGFIPKLLLYFLNERKKVNKQISLRLKEEENFDSTDEFKRLDTLQLLMKLKGNTIYGLLTSEHFIIKGRIIGESCTAVGRTLIKYVDQGIHGLEVCEDGILYYDKQVINSFNISIPKYITKEINNIQDKVIIQLKSQYIDTDSNYMICLPFNKKAESYLTLTEEEKLLSDKDKLKIMDEKFSQYLKILIKIGNVVCNYINEYLLFENIQTKFENIMFEAIFSSSKQYSGKIISADNPNKVKDKYSGTVMKKRSYSLIQKTIINSINKNIEVRLRYRMSINFDMLKHMLDKVINIYLKSFYCSNVDINDYIITRKYNNIYKNENNHNLEIVKEYNSIVGDLKSIAIGNRYKYIYITDNVTDRFLKVPKGISKYEFIVDDHKIVDGYIVNNSIKRLDESKKYRILYEVYYERCISGIVRLYYNTEAFQYAKGKYKEIFNENFDDKLLKI